VSTKVHEAGLQKPRLDLPDPSYEEVRDAWMRHRELEQTKKGLPAHRLKDGTLTFQGKAHLDAFFSGWQAKHIDTEDIEKLQQVLLSRGMGNGIDRTTAALSAMLHHAVTTGRLRPEQLPRFPKKIDHDRREPLPIDEKYVKPVLAALPEPYRTGFALAYHMGMRLDGEIARLRWENIVSSNGNSHLYFAGAKTFEWRRVPLLADTAKLLARLKEGKPTDLVLPGFADRTARARAWRHAAAAVGLGAWHCKKCGARLTDMKCPDHGLLTERDAKYRGSQFRHTRHTAARNLVNRGVPLPRVMQALGHKHLPTHMGYNVAQEADLNLIRELYDRKAKTVTAM
jgi:integrase